MTEIKDEFIGRSFKNCVVTGWNGQRRNGAKLYSIHCSICSFDKELFPCSIFYTTKRSLLQNKLPCGCAAGPNWNLNQYLIRVRRKSPTLVVISVGTFKGSQTNLVVKCEKQDHIYNTKFLYILSGCGCRDCSALNKRRSDLDLTQEFKNTGCFVAGTKFWNNKEKDPSGKYYWYVSCPICSDDLYVKNNVCTGVFKSTYSNLTQGMLPCRCSNRYLWSKEQRDFQIKQITAVETNYQFIGWSEEYKNYQSKIKLNCLLHKEFEVDIGSFVNSHRRCPECASHGFKTRLPASIYALEIEKGNEIYTGFGITNELDIRLAAHKRELFKEGFNILNIFSRSCAGVDARNIEASIKQNFTCINLGVAGFKREATKHDFKTICDFLSDHELVHKEK